MTLLREKEWLTALRMDLVQACAEPGDVILFNGKILHRGRANVSDQGRGVLYVSHTKRWYDDSYQ